MKIAPGLRPARAWRYWVLTLGVVGLVLIVAFVLTQQYVTAFGFPDGNRVREALQAQGTDALKAEAIRAQAQTAWGQLGDFLGGTLNPLVSFLALFVLLLNYKSQTEELRATQETLQNQVNATFQDRQEARFFDLIRLYQDTIDEVKFRLRDGVYEGKRAFFEFNNLHIDVTSDPIEESIKRAVAQLRTHDYLFDHYFRVLFNILSISKTLLNKDLHVFLKLLRAQLSKDELIVLALNTQSEEGRKMISLIEDFGLLKHLPKGPFRSKLEESLPRKCFGNGFAQIGII